MILHEKHKTLRQRGFTLAEVLVAGFLFALVTIGLTSFTTEASRGMSWVSSKSRITNDVRNFTLRISKETLDARTGIVYKSFSKSDRDEVGDQLQSGDSGDCLILVYYDPYPNIEDDPHYTKIVVFFRNPDVDGLSPVYRAEKVFSTPQAINTTTGSDPNYDHFEDLIATHFPDSPSNYPIVLELSRGLANGQLFRNFGNNTFVVNGEILHGNNAQEVTNTYNLTISPRG